MGIFMRLERQQIHLLVWKAAAVQMLDIADMYERRSIVEIPEHFNSKCSDYILLLVMQRTA